MLVIVAAMLWRFQRVAAADYLAQGGGSDLQAQLDWIGAELRRGSGEKTQEWYPEGYFFAHAIYGYALVNHGLLNPDDGALLIDNIAEIEWVLTQLESERGRAPFSPDQAISFGVFYTGWLNKLLGGLLLLQDEESRQPHRVNQFHEQTAILATAFESSPTLHLEAYPGGSWPVDNVVALSSLRLHDELFGSDYGRIVDDWIAYTQEHLDPETGLLPHRINAKSGQIYQGSRGSSLVMATAFLPELDKDFAQEQYGRFRQQYAQPFMGFILTREYPIGVNGPSDVDSGPIVLGFSAVSTGVSLVSARANGDNERFERMAQLSEMLGMPFTFRGQKRYSLGQLPIGDAFLVWGKSIVPWHLDATHPQPQPFSQMTPTVNWWVYGIGLILLLLLLFIVRKKM